MKNDDFILRALKTCRERGNYELSREGEQNIKDALIEVIDPKPIQEVLELVQVECVRAYMQGKVNYEKVSRNGKYQLSVLGREDIRKALEGIIAAEKIEGVMRLMKNEYAKAYRQGIEDRETDIERSQPIRKH